MACQFWQRQDFGKGLLMPPLHQECRSNRKRQTITILSPQLLLLLSQLLRQPLPKCNLPPLVKIRPWIPRHLMHTTHDCRIWSMMISVQWILLFLSVLTISVITRVDTWLYWHQDKYSDVLTIDISSTEQIYGLKTFWHLRHKTGYMFKFL